MTTLAELRSTLNIIPMKESSVVVPSGCFCLMVSARGLDTVYFIEGVKYDEDSTLIGRVELPALDADEPSIAIAYKGYKKASEFIGCFSSLDNALLGLSRKSLMPA